MYNRKVHNNYMSRFISGSLFDIQVQSILKYLFPVPKADSKRVITFANTEDYISFRYHVRMYIVWKFLSITLYYIIII